MRFAFTSDQLHFRSALRALLEQHCTPAHVRAVFEGREQRVPHQRRNVLERHELAALDAIFGQQFAVARENPQRQRGTIDGQMFDGRQLRPDSMDRPCADARARECQAEQRAREDAPCAATWRCGTRRRRRRGSGVVGHSGSFFDAATAGAHHAPIRHERRALSKGCRNTGTIFSQCLAG